MPTSEITWQDIEQLPDDGRRYEAIEGDLYVTAAPSFGEIDLVRIFTTD